MKAEKWMSTNGYYKGQILQYISDGETRLVSVDEILEQYAQHSAQERYDEAMKYFDECIKEAKVSGENYAFCFNFIISERANICAKASGLDTPNNDEG